MLVGAGLASDLGRLLDERAGGGKRVVITDVHVDLAWPALLPGVPRLVFPAGEQHKTRESWAELTDRVLALGVDRDAVIVAIGGGVATDLAGFVAATLLRGVRWVAVPTSTLAMLDAAVGGKTGVDTRHGKNLVGAFHPPSVVVADPALLATLPARPYREGLAEAVKHAAIADASLWAWLEEHAASVIERDVDLTTELVHRSLAIKAAVVSEDEHESGQRATLNAGHTIAHALEHATDFALPHGEAVAIGLVLETRIAEARGLAPRGTATRIAALLGVLGLPSVPPGHFDFERFIAALQHDKKNRDAAIRAALLADIGSVARDDDGGWTRALTSDEILAIVH